MGINRRTLDYKIRNIWITMSSSVNDLSEFWKDDVIQNGWRDLTKSRDASSVKARRSVSLSWMQTRCDPRKYTCVYHITTEHARYVDTSILLHVDVKTWKRLPHPNYWSKCRVASKWAPPPPYTICGYMDNRITGAWIKRVLKDIAFSVQNI